MGQASGLFCVQFILLLDIENNYHIICMYYLNYEHTRLWYKQFYRLLHIVILLVISL